MKAEKYEKNMGIELLRICSMYMIVIMHVAGANLSSSNLWYIALHPICNCAVNVFALISGYVQYKRKCKLKNVFTLYGVVWFYSVVLTFSIWFYKRKYVVLSDLVYSLFPLFSARYWYYTAYVGMNLFTKYLDGFINRTSKAEDKKVICKIIVVSMVMPFLKDYGIGMKEGFSMCWLLCLYMIGMYLAKYEKEVIKRKCVIYMGGGISLGYISVAELIISSLVEHRRISEGYMGIFDKYNSPFLVFYSVALFLFFVQIKLKGKIGDFVGLVSLSSFSVYLIHTNTAFHKLFIEKRFVHINDLTPIRMFTMLLLICFILYAVCTILDMIRKSLFNVLGYGILVERLCNKLERYFSGTWLSHEEN